MSNKQKLYIFAFFQTALVIIPVVVPYFLSIGLSMAQIFKLQAIFGLTVTLCELPTGYIADLWGRKKTLVIGSFLLGISFTYLLFAKLFHQLVIFEIIGAVGISLISGADIAILYQEVADSDKAARSKVLSNRQLAERVGEAFAALLGGFLVVYSFQAVLIANAIMFWVPFAIALTMHETRHQKPNTTSHIVNCKEILAHLTTNKDVILKLGFLNHIIWGIATYLAAWMLQRYWQINHIDLVYFGMLWASFCLVAGLTGKCAHAIERRLGALFVLAIIGLAPVIGYTGMAMTEGGVGVIFGLFFYICWGLNNVVFKDIINWRSPNRFRSTINSAQSFFFRMGTAIFGPLVGLSIDSSGMYHTLWILGGVFFVLCFFALFPLMLAIHKTPFAYIPESKDVE